ncbi:hypothetical protein BC937DRAFT_92120 [Endogone sp. FLAS-F59071]|nr:hypothetical protein BC937DRAFT_92120 [Endogone sp. FLAS-F59071]|eukprot:RUS15694.1 hypothetical protein BC937DRAFT_92120 [Endogone sp. FLAS-F59071]
MATLPPQDNFATSYSLPYHPAGYAFVNDTASYQDSDAVLLALGRPQQQCSFDTDQLAQPYLLSYPPTMGWAGKSDDGSESALCEFYDSSSPSSVSSPEQSVYGDFEGMSTDMNTWSCSEESFPTQAQQNQNFLLTSEYNIANAQHTMGAACMPSLHPFATSEFDASALLAPTTAEQMKIIMYEPSNEFGLTGFNDVLPQSFDGFPTPAPSPKMLSQHQVESISGSLNTALPPSPPQNTLDLDFNAAAAAGPYSNFNNLTAVMRCSHAGCPKTFSRIYNLKAHLKSHASTKPFDCQMCSRSFSRKHDLQRHVRVHTGAKPYICPCCKKGFARTDALKRHLRIEESCRMSVEVQSMKSRRRYSDL